MKNENLLLLCFCATRFTAVAALRHSNVCLLTYCATVVIEITIVMAIVNLSAREQLA